MGFDVSSTYPDLGTRFNFFIQIENHLFPVDSEFSYC